MNLMAFFNAATTPTDQHVISQYGNYNAVPVGWGGRMHRLHFCRGVRSPPPTSVQIMTLNNLMVRLP